MMNPRMDKLVRRTTIVATVTTAYFLLTADYGSEPHVLDPPSFQMWTDQMQETLDSKKNGDSAFKQKDFRSRRTLEPQSSVINSSLMLETWFLPQFLPVVVCLISWMRCLRKL